MAEKIIPAELGTESTGKLLKKYAIPAIIAMTASSLYNMIDSIFIGHGVGALAIAGLAVTYAVYQSMNYMQVPFVVPVWPLVGMTVFITAVCVGIPLAAGARMIRKGSVVERVRGM